MTNDEWARAVRTAAPFRVGALNGTNHQQASPHSSFIIPHSSFKEPDMGQTLIEKIANRYAVGLKPGQKVHAGDYLSIRPKHVMTHDNTSAVIPKFAAIGATKIHDPGQPVFCLDHDIQNMSPENLAKYAKIEAFARKHGIAFYKAGSGIGHQIMVEEGFVTPGALVVASDSHSNLYGGAAALGTPVVRTDAAAIWATGKTWWQVPPIAKVTLAGLEAAGERRLRDGRHLPPARRGRQGRDHRPLWKIQQRRGAQPRLRVRR